eukprot:scpid92447/ scgid33574/ 
MALLLHYNLSGLKPNKPLATHYAEIEWLTIVPLIMSAVPERRTNTSDSPQSVYCGICQKMETLEMVSVRLGLSGSSMTVEFHLPSFLLSTSSIVAATVPSIAMSMPTVMRCR